MAAWARRARTVATAHRWLVDALLAALVGMRERAGPRAGGAFEVHATFPRTGSRA